MPVFPVVGGCYSSWAVGACGGGSSARTDRSMGCLRGDQHTPFTLYPRQNFAQTQELAKHTVRVNTQQEQRGRGGWLDYDFLSAVRCHLQFSSASSPACQCQPARFVSGSLAFNSVPNQVVVVLTLMAPKQLIYSSPISGGGGGCLGCSQPAGGCRSRHQA